MAHTAAITSQSTPPARKSSSTEEEKKHGSNRVDAGSVKGGEAVRGNPWTYGIYLPVALDLLEVNKKRR